MHKIKRLIILSIIFKITVSALLFGIFYELKRHADVLSPQHQASLTALQNSIDSMQHKLLSFDRHPSSNDNGQVEKTEETISAIRYIFKVLNEIPNGKLLDLEPLHNYISDENWKIVSAAEKNISGSDVELVKELQLCMQYLDDHGNNKSNMVSKPLDKVISIEDKYVYDHRMLIKNVLLDSVHAISYSNYKMALNFLDKITGNDDISNCVANVKVAVQQRAAVESILLTVQKRILDDQ